MQHFFKPTIPLKALYIFFAVSLISICSTSAQKKDPIFPWNAEVRGGAAFPTSDFAETVNVGADFGARFGYSLRERFMLRAGVETEFYSGAEGFEDTQLWHYSGGVEYLFTDRGLTQWRLSGHAGMGASTMTFDNATEVSETYFSLNYGVKMGRGITDNFDWFVSIMGRTVFANPQDASATSTFTTIPITIGINHRFNLSDQPLTEKVEQPPVE